MAAAATPGLSDRSLGDFSPDGGVGCCTLEGWLRWSDLGPARVVVDAVVKGDNARDMLGLWRLTVFLYAAGSVIYDWFSQERFVLIFLTHWGSTATIIYFGIATVVSINHTFKCLVPREPSAAGRIQRSCSGHLMASSWVWANRFAFFMFEFAFCFEAALTILYWVVLYDGRELEFDNVNVHAALFVLMFLELLVSRMRFHTRHLSLVFLLSIAYLFVNLAVCVACPARPTTLPSNKRSPYRTLDDEPVYSVLTWDKGSDAVLVIGAFILMVVGWFFGVGAAALRDKVFPYARKAPAEQTESGLDFVKIAGPSRKELPPGV